MDDARRIRDYWFGTLPRTAVEFASRLEVWFGAGLDTAAVQTRDAEIRGRFGALWQRAAAGALDGWADGPRRRLSLILLLDPFSRHIHRGTAQAFAQDERALQLAVSGMQSGADAALDPVERIFFYLPLQHAESLTAQEESVAAAQRLLLEAPPALEPGFRQVLAAAREHYAIIASFGRFPHRNRILGRVTTAAEVDWLRRHPAPFGQP